MFRQAAHALHEVSHNLESIGVVPNPAMGTNIKLAIKRDLQAQRLRPNVPVPPRRAVLSYLKTMRAETGSWKQALLSLLHSGSWTSSGGSFRLASVVDRDISELCEVALQRGRGFKFLEIGAGWAGFATVDGGQPDGIAALARRFADRLGVDVELHFTNLTRWHNKGALPQGVVEHPYVTAAGLAAVEQQGIQPQSVDVIYSQAAAYFESNQANFILSAARLLKPNGVLIYNHSEEDTDVVKYAAEVNGLYLEHRHKMGGMNGDVVILRKLAQVAAFRPREQRNLSPEPVFATHQFY